MARCLLLLLVEQHKAAMRLSRQHHHHPSSIPAHSPSDPSYSNPSSKRHSHDLGYPTNDYPASIWRAQNLPNPSHPMKHTSANNENPLLKLNELSRYSSARVVNERRSR